MDEFRQEQEKQASQHLPKLNDTSLGKGNPLLELLQGLAARLDEQNLPDLEYPILEDFQNLVEDQPEEALDCLLLLMDRETWPVPENFQDLEYWASQLIPLCLQELNLLGANSP